MTPTTRKPIYHSDRRLRIVSAPNGEWQAQHNSKPDEPGTKESDRWEPLGRPTTFANAEAQVLLKAAAWRQIKRPLQDKESQSGLVHQMFVSLRAPHPFVHSALI